MPHRIAIDARKVDDFGIGTYIRNLVSHLGQLDQDNRYLLLVHPQSQPIEGLPKNFRRVLVRSRVYSMSEQLTLSWLLVRLRVHLYHATHYTLPLYVPSPTVVTIHDIIHLLFPEYLPNRLAAQYARYMIRRSLVRADRVITVSANTRTDLRDHFPVASDKIEVIYNGVDPVFREPLSEERMARWQSRLDLAPPYVLFVGNPKPHKNLDNVIKAYARAREIARFEGPLVCVGSRESSDLKLVQRAEQLGIRDQLRLLGHVAAEALPAIYQGATLFLYPTLYEGFGLPVVEAMAAGAPVITSTTSALREIGEGYAHLVDPLDVEKMAQAIAHLMSSPDHRKSLSRLGRRRSLDFDWRAAASATLAVYRQILGASEPAPRPATERAR